MTVINNLSSINKGSEHFALLVDPDKYNHEGIKYIVENACTSSVDIFFVGGSLITNLDRFTETIIYIKKNSDIPVVLFPGSVLQISDKADAILLLSLISGRNPDYLIGNHVIAAKILKQSGLQVIPTGYILIENGNTSSVEYISNTKPIPSDKTDIVVSTAIAGELTGNKFIYLEAGSGAKKPVPAELIKHVSNQIDIPLIVGGGITNQKNMDKAFKAGANVVVVGNAFEKNSELLNQFD